MKIPGITNFQHMAGYAKFEGMSFADAYVAAMILSGMGPLGELKTTAGKKILQVPTQFSPV